MILVINHHDLLGHGLTLEVTVSRPLLAQRFLLVSITCYQNDSEGGKIPDLGIIHCIGKSSHPHCLTYSKYYKLFLKG